MADTQQQQRQITPEELDAMQQAAVLTASVPMFQPLKSIGVDTTKDTVIKIQPKNVGIITGFRVIVEGRIQNTDGAVDSVTTPFGISNILSNIKFTDLNSHDRINTTGWHLALLNTARGRWPYASALQSSVFGTPLESASANYGANWPVLVNPKGVTHGTNVAFRMVYDVPLAYDPTQDLRGAMFANVLDTNSELQLTINTTPFVATGADDTGAVQRSGTCSFLGNLQITVYQSYLDQIPLGADSKPILPWLALSTLYELKQTASAGLVAGQEFPVSYSNLRSFLSTFFVYNNSGGNDGHGIGADVDYFSLNTANTTAIFKKDPLTVAQDSRDIAGVDFPQGTYYFSHRKKPLSTRQYGNMQLTIKPITAGAGAYLLVGYEYMSLVNSISDMGSLK